MATVVRLKRRLNENPLETLILNCKRPKNDETSAQTEDLSAVLQLAGTSQQQENLDQILLKHHPNVQELKEQYKKHNVNVSDKLRQEARENSRNNRYKIVNTFRRNLGASGGSEVTVYDVETDANSNDIVANTEEAPSSSESPKYVYDFYYTSSDDLGHVELEGYVSLHAPGEPLVFGVNNDEESEESEDSNAENFWTNDYPDEEDLESVNEDDMIAAVKNLKIDDDLLSSDEEEDNFVYSREEEEFQEAEEVDKQDELRYGKMYAKFKAKNKGVVSDNLARDLYYGDSDEEEFDF